jgi:hypothetical protein
VLVEFRQRPGAEARDLWSTVVDTGLRNEVRNGARSIAEGPTWLRERSPARHPQAWRVVANVGRARVPWVAEAYLGLWLSCIDSDRNARRAGGNRPPVFGSLGIPVVSRPIQQRCHVGENVL